MITEIKPIETIYNGYRFRSRLEARWAVFLDSLGVKYEYEPEGFELPGVGGYLPDFRILCHASRGTEGEPFPLYIEVKGLMDEASAEKIKAFSWYNAFRDFPEPPMNTNGTYLYDDPDYKKCLSNWENIAPKRYSALLIVSDIPNIERVSDIYNDRVLECYNNMGFGLHPFNYETIDGDHFGAYPCVWDGKFGLLGDEGGYLGWGDHIHTAYAYIAARRARFEYGERPQLVPMDCRGRLRLLKAQDIFGAIT